MFFTMLMVGACIYKILGTVNATRSVLESIIVYYSIGEKNWKIEQQTTLDKIWSYLREKLLLVAWKVYPKYIQTKSKTSAIQQAIRLWEISKSLHWYSCIPLPPSRSK